jgi:hypothetical protein
MQSAADSTALAVGKEMNLFLEDLGPLRQSGMDRAEVLLEEVGLAGRQHTIEVTLDKEKATSRVEIAMPTRTFLPPEIWGSNPIVVTAEAKVLGTDRLCILSLDKGANRALASPTDRITRRWSLESPKIRATLPSLPMPKSTSSDFNLEREDRAFSLCYCREVQNYLMVVVNLLRTKLS